MITTHRGPREAIQYFAHKDRGIDERDKLARSLDTTNGGHLLDKRHIGLASGYYFVAIEEQGQPVYAFAQEGATGQISCIRLDGLDRQWCNDLRNWLKV